MAGTTRGDDPTDPRGADRDPADVASCPDPTVEARWSDLERRLAAQLLRMDDDEESDLLIVEVPGFDDEGPGSAPYVLFAGADGGARLHTEASSNDQLTPQFLLDETACRSMRAAGWHGADAPEKNWFRDDGLAAAPEVARSVVVALREQFGVAHPELLTYRAWGRAAGAAGLLGLVASTAVPVDRVDRIGPDAPSGTSLSTVSGDDEADEMTSFRREFTRPKDLTDVVIRFMRKNFDDVVVDDTGALVVRHLGHLVFVNIMNEEPAVHVSARVVHNARSRAATAVEVELLNRDDLWMKWTVRRRTIWQEVTIPALPFAELHLAVLMDIFLHTLERTRDDLALRTGGEVG